MPSHLSDEAVAAFADGVLRGHARSRAARHVDTCAECRQAVRAQREAVWALRRAPAPSLPAGLFERLQCLPNVRPDGHADGGPSASSSSSSSASPSATEPADNASSMFSMFAPVAAFAPPSRPGEPADPEVADGTDEPEDHRAMWGLAALLATRSRRRS